MQQLVHFHYAVSISGIAFEAHQNYVFEIRVVDEKKYIYYQNTLLGQIDCFQNQYVETHCVSWIDQIQDLDASAA